MHIVLARKLDIKLRHWASAWRDKEYRVQVCPTWAGMARALIQNSAKAQPASVTVLFRYLNDRPSWPASFGTLCSDLLVLLAAAMVRARVIWICHNLDNETKVYHPRLTWIRRRAVGFLASRIYVTDPLLVPEAELYLPASAARKVTWTCFGEMESFSAHKIWGSDTEPTVREEIESFSRRMRAEAESHGRISLIGLCLGRPGPKYLHYAYARSLLEAAESTPFHVSLIVAIDRDGAIELGQESILEELRVHPRVWLYDRVVGFHEGEMRDHFDFLWRGYSDWSTPITVYTAATVGRPLLVLRAGFLPLLVETYELGSVVSLDMCDLESALGELASWNGGGAERFLSERGWETGGSRLLMEVDLELDGPEHRSPRLQLASSLVDGEPS